MGSTAEWWYKDRLPELEEEERQRMKNSTDEIGKDEEPWTAFGMEMKDEDFMKVAQEAQRRDITFNKMINIILKDGLRSSKQIFEHPPKAQLLNETE